MIRWLALLMLFALPAKAEEIVLGLSRDEVAITATFEGSDILVFGAIKREAPADADSQLGVIVTIAGPDQPVMVRRKDRRLGIWVNTDAVEVDAAPSFYAVASSGPMRDVLKDTEDLRHRITIPRIIRSVGAEIDNSLDFTNALIRIRAGQELYQVQEGAVSVDQETLFRTAITLPANLTEGDYEAHIFLTRDGVVVDDYVTTIPVQKVGLERWLYNLAHDNALIYGLMSLAIAIASGWLASAAFSLLRP
ncbi:MAG: TIGR02186 family protein [Pseudomonadota bacterium]